MEATFEQLWSPNRVTEWLGLDCSLPAVSWWDSSSQDAFRRTSRTLWRVALDGGAKEGAQQGLLLGNWEERFGGVGLVAALAGLWDTGGKGRAFGNIAQACRDDVKEEKPQLELGVTKGCERRQEEFLLLCWWPKIKQGKRTGRGEQGQLVGPSPAGLSLATRCQVTMDPGKEQPSLGRVVGAVSWGPFSWDYPGSLWLHWDTLKTAINKNIYTKHWTGALLLKIRCPQTPVILTYYRPILRFLF